MDLCSSGVELVGHEEDMLRVSYEPERGDVNDVRVRWVDDDATDLLRRLQSEQNVGRDAIVEIASILEVLADAPVADHEPRAELTT